MIDIIYHNQKCLLCGKQASCFNAYGFACDPKHLWFRAIDETAEQTKIALKIRIEYYKTNAKKT
jgi:hypothetical protein